MERLRRLGQRWPWFDRVLDTHERVGAVNGGFVASGITVAVFLSLFPLILVVIAVVGFLAAGNADVPRRIVSGLGLHGSAARTMRDAVTTASNSRQAASVIGLAGLVWSASGVAVALQMGVRAPWHQRPDGLRDRLMGTAWLAVAAVGFAAVLALGGLLRFLPSAVPKPITAAGVVLLGLAAEVGLFLWMFWGLGDRRVPWRGLLPGAVVAGVGFEVLKLVGTVYVPQLVARSSALYGPLGIVFALIVWLSFFARLIVYSSALNAVRFDGST